MRKLAAVVFTLALIVPPCVAQIDGAQMSEQLKKKLLIAPDWTDTLELVAEDGTGDTAPPEAARYDITRVYFANVAEGRWVWAIEFAQPYTFDNASLILYVDSDNDPQTRREGMGCEVTYGHSQGSPTQMFYLSEDRRADFPGGRVAIEDGVLYISADLPLNQQDGRSVFRQMILSEQRDPHESRDSMGFRDISGPGDTDRERVRTLADLQEPQGFDVTQDMGLLWDIHGDERNVIRNAFRDCEPDGYEYYHSEYRWPAMRRTAGEGTLRTQAAEGRWYLGAVVYDQPGREVYEFAVDGEPVGQFIADAGNKRQRLFFTPQPITFTGDEIIELRAAGESWSVVEDIMLLADRPEKRRPAKRLEHLDVGWDWDRECMRATWVTTWPVACELIVGEQEIAEDEPIQNHRVYLPELEEGRDYALTIDAAEAGVHALRFVAEEPEVRPCASARASVELSVLNDGRELPAGYPLTVGVPFAQGALDATDHLRLLAGGEEIALQARPLVRWPDGSVKVALLDFPAPVTDAVTLEFGRDVTRSEVTDPVTVSRNGDALNVNAACLTAEFDLAESGLFTRLERDGMALTDPDRPARISLVDADGNEYDTLAAPEEIAIEEAGPMRAVVRLDGHHTSDAGELFEYRIRLAFFARYPAVQMTYRWMNDHAGLEFTEFDAIRFELPLASEGADVLIGADEPTTASLDDEVGIEQLRDNGYSGAAEGERAPGWISADGLTLACADFWQLYPKGIGVEDGALYLDICPDFADGEYDDCTERELYKLYYYLQNGVYKIRQGTAKTHDLWIDLSGTDGDTVAALAGEPPVIVAPDQWYADSGAFGQFVPISTGHTPRYDEVCDRVLSGALSHREGAQEFGMLNYGDQWGERGANWANGEYDHHHTSAQMMVRGHDPYAWNQLMRDQARHDHDVDLCHFHDQAGYIGGSWAHSIGHVGSYIDQQMEGQYGSPRAGQSPTHTWTRGTTEYFMLTGDPAGIEAARTISDHYGGTWLNNYDFTNGRYPGWHLIATMATYHATGDPFYLNAARIIVDRVMERRTPGGGWIRQLLPGHCYCEPRCSGLCSFMQGILGVGLHDYWLATGDERVEEAIPEAARVVLDEIWEDDVEMFRYTSCPNSSLTSSRADTLGGLMLFAWELSGDPQFADVAIRSMNLGFEDLGSLSHMRWTPYIVYALDRLHRLQEPGVGGERGATLLLRNEEAGPLQVRLFDRGGSPAPADAAELRGPDGDSWEPAEDGRIVVEDGVEGVYRLTLERDGGPWQVTSSVNRVALSLAGGLELDVPEGTTQVLIEARDGEDRRLGVRTLAGESQWRLLSLDGDEIDPRDAITGELCAVELTGPGHVRISAGQAWSPWAALYEGAWFNASAPEVRIDGKTAFAPGEGRTVRLSALVDDLDDDVQSVRWLLPDGREVEGEQVEFEAPEGASLATVRAVASDAAGNTGEAAVQVQLPEPELAGTEGAVTVQAEDFSGQGEGEVEVVDRVGDVGRMITKWHADLGHWLEWTVQVPEEGDYEVWARYATDSANTVRSLSVDGEEPGEGYGELCFPSTGGFCTSADNWALQRLGEPIHLAAGAHTLRMTNLGEGLALDYLTLVPVEE